MSFRVIISWPVKPGSIYDVLTRKLGREPTSAELRADLDRIRDEALVDRATRGTLPHQRRRRR